MKIQITYKICSHLLLTTCLLLFWGCGKNEPVGYDMVSPREGKIKIAKGEVTSFTTSSEFANMSKAFYLFAGKEANFEAKAFIYFKCDTLILPETLWVIGVDSGEVEICKVDSINIDSLTWGVGADFICDTFDTFWVGDTSSVCVDELGDDSVFYIGFQSTAGMVSFHSPAGSNKPWLSIDTNRYIADKGTYIDTSYFSQDSLPDSLTYIETGGFVTRCTLYIRVGILDTSMSRDTFWIDTLSDSLRDMFKGASVNKAELKLGVDTVRSYKWDIELRALYEVNNEKVYSNRSSPDGDYIVFSIDKIIDKWFKEGNRLWVVIFGETEKLSRVIFDTGTAELSIIYTEPPKPRE